MIRRLSTTVHPIEIDRLSKRFGSVQALSDVSFRVEAGEIFGFLGPNGAGKSTTLNVLLDFVKPTSGSVSVLGMDAQTHGKEIRRRIGVLPEGYQTYGRLTGRQHVEFAIESKAADDDPDDLIERVGLTQADADRPSGGYSKGMAQRLTLAMALVGEPDLLILDEPSTGLDPNGAREMREIVLEENERGATVFFSSHILAQVEAVCDRVGIIAGGEMVAVDTVDGLRESVTAVSTLVVRVDRVDEDAMEALRNLPGVMRVAGHDDHGRPTVVIESEGSKLDALTTLQDAGVTVEDFRTEEASLEDVFHAYTTGGAARGDRSPRDADQRESDLAEEVSS